MASGSDRFLALRFRRPQLVSDGDTVECQLLHLPKVSAERVPRARAYSLASSFTDFSRWWLAGCATDMWRSTAMRGCVGPIRIVLLSKVLPHMTVCTPVSFGRPHNPADAHPYRRKCTTGHAMIRRHKRRTPTPQPHPTHTHAHARAGAVRAGLR